MEGYIGEFVVDINSTPFADYTEKDWALHFIERYGQIDGDHHKAWVLDQVARILHGTPVEVLEARWKNGHTEYRVKVHQIPTLAYSDWVHEMRNWDGEEQEYEYGYDKGIAP